MTDLAQLELDLINAIGAAETSAALEDIRVAALGKSGTVTGLLKGMGALSPDDVSATTLAGEQITGKLTEAPGNGAKIGGLKVTTESAWFAARPSGTEDVYKIYAESFRGPEHLAQV